MKFAIATLLVFLSQPVFSATINVPVDQPTIQAGIDSASNGDIVLVAAGTYTGDGNRDIVFEGKRITLRSADGPTLTIIDCEGSIDDYHRGFLLNQGEIHLTVIDGFTIQNGFVNGVGGAIRCVNTGPTIKNCIFDSNQSSWSGGALATDHAPANVQNCLFINNEAVGYGGACYLSYSVSIFYNCTFFQNGADSGGAALYSNFSDPVIYYTLITHSRLPGAAVVQTGTQQLHSTEFDCSNIWGNPGGDWPLGYPTQLGVRGNISEDPLYCADVPTVFPDDLYINSQSPCAPENHECGALVGCYGVGCGPTGVDDDSFEQLPAGYNLAQNYPNPFNPATRIDFELPRGAQVKLTVFNTIGNKVTVLVDEYLSAGSYSQIWDGSEAPSGVYLYRLEVGEISTTRKMVLL